MGNIAIEAKFTVTATKVYIENNLTMATFCKHRQTWNKCGIFVCYSSSVLMFLEFWQEGFIVSKNTRDISIRTSQMSVISITESIAARKLDLSQHW